MTPKQQRVDKGLREIARLSFHDPHKFFRDDGAPLAILELDGASAAIRK